MIASEAKSVSVTADAVVAIADVGFTEARLAEANVAVISCVGNNINVLWTGDDPTSTLGHSVIKTSSLAANIPCVIGGKENVANIKMIGLGGTATVTITIGR
jgi:hypothetical protein